MSDCGSWFWAGLYATLGYTVSGIVIVCGTVASVFLFFLLQEIYKYFRPTLRGKP